MTYILIYKVSNNNNPFNFYCIIILLAPPSIEIPPTNQTVLEGVDVQFSCLAIADPMSDFHWDFNNIRIESGARHSFPMAGQLHVRNVTFGDIGLYLCNASNEHGWDTAIAYLDVQG